MSHCHHRSCEHENVRYCKHCGVVYCVDCKEEWRKGYWSYPYTYYTWPYTITCPQSTYSVTNTNQSTQNSASCNHV